MRLSIALLVILSACKPLTAPTTPIDVELYATARRTVTDRTPRVWSCDLTLAATAAKTQRGAFVELLSLRRVIDLEGATSGSTLPAAARFGTRRLYNATQLRGTDSFSTTFPFTARFSYTLYYRDLALRIDSAKTAVQCG